MHAPSSRITCEKGRDIMRCSCVNLGSEESTQKHITVSVSPNCSWLLLCPLVSVPLLALCRHVDVGTLACAGEVGYNTKIPAV